MSATRLSERMPREYDLGAIKAMLDSMIEAGVLTDAAMAIAQQVGIDLKESVLPMLELDKGKLATFLLRMGDRVMIVEAHVTEVTQHMLEFDRHLSIDLRLHGRVVSDSR